jgi:hypothetical protein
LIGKSGTTIQRRRDELDHQVRIADRGAGPSRPTRLAAADCFASEFGNS